MLEKIQKFMYGRYGPDELYHFLFKLYIIFLIIDLFIKSDILVFLELLVVIVMFYRFFSKKIYRRSDENKLFLKIKSRVLKPFRNFKKNFDRKIKNIKDENYIYKKCHKCGTVLRLPVPDKYGIRHVKCPKCKKRLTILCLKKEKIEVIKNDKKRRR